MSPRIVRALHVEDDKFQQRVLARLLAEMNEFQFEIVCAESEQEGLDLFERKGADLIILDYHLTTGNGLHFLRELRRGAPHVPVIAVSGKAGPEIGASFLNVELMIFWTRRNSQGT